MHNKMLLRFGTMHRTSLIGSLLLTASDYNTVFLSQGLFHKLSLYELTQDVYATKQLDAEIIKAVLTKK